MSERERERKESTLAALLEEKPRRGRPRRSVSRQNVYVAISSEQREQIERLTNDLPDSFSRADIPDIAIHLLATRLELLRQAVSGRNREIPEGVTDLDSLYLLWDLPLPKDNGQAKWTTIRLAPQQVIELGRVHGTLNALFGVNRSEVFALSLSLLVQFLNRELEDKSYKSLQDINDLIAQIYL